MTDRIKSLISNLKHLPGVYLMHDKNNTIIYVGKAKDLYRRVSQYFLRPQSGKVHKMVTEVEYFETIITKNDKEALVLEMNLIQTHYPKFNILLKDGSHYPYIALSKSGDPTLSIKRNNKDKHYDYYGPFPNSGAAFEMCDLINRLFPIRKCKTLGHSTCLYYHLGECLAPCINSIDVTVFDNLREEIKSFLKGNNQKQLQLAKSKMQEASKELKFEEAVKYKKIVDAINHINASQNVETIDKKDRDIFAFYSRDTYLSIAVLTFRKGILLGKQSFIVESFGDQEEQVVDLISQYYLSRELPHEIIINNDSIVKSLTDLYEDTEIYSVTKGKIHELVVSANENASNALDEYFLTARLDEDKLALLEELGSILKINTPLHIDLFDNSHLQGSSPVGALVTFINGEPNKKLYRKFKIVHDESRDDLESMKEVMHRHYSRSIDEHKNLPDLILVDGGTLQINAAKAALDGLGLSDKIPLFGLEKNDKHQTSNLIDINGVTYPLENKKIFFLLTRMQDEVHRFAISFHTDKRSKAMTSSLLDGVPGLGNKRKELIFRAFQDINSLKKASIEEFNQFLPKDVSEALYNKIHGID